MSAAANETPDRSGCEDSVAQLPRLGAARASGTSHHACHGARCGVERLGEVSAHGGGSLVPPRQQAGGPVEAPGTAAELPTQQGLATQGRAQRIRPPPLASRGALLRWAFGAYHYSELRRPAAAARGGTPTKTRGAARPTTQRHAPPPQQGRAKGGKSERQGNELRAKTSMQSPRSDPPDPLVPAQRAPGWGLPQVKTRPRCSQKHPGPSTGVRETRQAGHTREAASQS